ncbi:MAG: ResB family protein [Actinomycetia bacterium]|nr:ResB family protein [Actinomycetes bacterium]
MADVRVPEEATAATERTAPGEAESFPEDKLTAAVDTRVPPPQAGWGWFRWGWRQLTSMRTALILLFLLALGAIPGSLLPQVGQDPAGVQDYFTSHPALAPWLNHLGLFNVFAAPWFAAIYLLLFASLVGCVVPRTFRLAGSARTPPPRAPRKLTRLPHSASYTVALPAQEAVAAAATMLSGKRFRLRRPADGDTTHWISAEKGYLREVGNLLFHLALLGVLVSIAVGGLFGYKADKLLVEGATPFSDEASQLDEFHPGRLVTGSDLAPFTIKLDKFSASYYTSGASAGEPSSFDAQVTYSSSPGAPAKPYDLRINNPLNVDSTKVYLIGHGYAPVFTVTDAAGKVVYDSPTVFVPQNTGTLLSDGVVKVQRATPSDELGFIGVFTPTLALSAGGDLESSFPAPDDPAVSLIAYAGNLGEDSGVPQSVYQLDTNAMTKITAQPFLLQPGGSYTLPGGRGKITFVGYKQWASLAITYDPGQIPALVCGILALAGLLLSFLVRRRRVFVRADSTADGAVVTVGGLARTDASGGFEDEFAELVSQLRAEQDNKAAEHIETKTGA